MSTRRLPAGKNIRTQPYKRPTQQQSDGYTRTNYPLAPLQQRTPAKYENLSYRRVEEQVSSDDDESSEEEMPPQQRQRPQQSHRASSVGSGPVAYCKKCSDKVQMTDVQRVPMYYKKDSAPNKKGEIAHREGDYMKDRYAGKCPNCDSNLSAFIGKEDN